MLRCLVLCFPSCWPMFAVALPELSGRVLDPNSRPVPKAQIRLTDNKGQSITETATNATGTFEMRLAPGRYRLTVERSGFAEQSKRVRMDGRDQQITITLALEQQTTSITVSDQASKLETASDSHQDSLKLSSSDLNGLPVKDGDVLSALSFFTNPAGGSVSDNHC